MARASLHIALAGALLVSLALASACNNRSRGRLPTDSGTGDTSSPGDTSVTDTGGPGDTSVADTSVTDTGGGGGDGDAAVAGYRGVVEADCQVAHRCRAELTTWLPDATDAEFVEVFGASVTSCVADRYPADGQAALRDAVNAGRIIYNAADTAACISTATGRTCEDFWTATSSIPACDTALIGTVPNGSMCTINGECVSVACMDGVCSTAAP